MVRSLRQQNTHVRTCFVPATRRAPAWDGLYLLLLLSSILQDALCCSPPTGLIACFLGTPRSIVSYRRHPGNKVAIFVKGHPSIHCTQNLRCFCHPLYSLSFPFLSCSSIIQRIWSNNSTVLLLRAGQYFHIVILLVVYLGGYLLFLSIARSTYIG